MCKSPCKVPACPRLCQSGTGGLCYKCYHRLAGVSANDFAIADQMLTCPGADEEEDRIWSQERGAILHHVRRQAKERVASLLLREKRV